MALVAERGIDGTSMDAIDAVLIECDLDAQTLQTIDLESLSLPESLRATLLQIAGPDLLEAGAVSVDLRGLDKPLSRLRVGVWTSDPLCAPSKAVVERVEAVAAALAAEGAEVDLAARPAFEARDSDFVFCALLFSAMANRMPEAMFADLVAKAEALDADDNSPRAWQLRWQTMRAWTKKAGRFARK